ncbi:MAG: hypothetical protein GY780_15770 [bacterium]|nr:hypothetical protein [bacterium]
MNDPKVVVQTLQDLGITRSEAEVYLATLQESGGGPVSGYRVAQSVGKDPANLSKTLASLEILGAVRTIQEKPRLYVPVSPDEFADKLIADIQRKRQLVLKQMEEFDFNRRQSVPMALNNQDQAISRAITLLSRCRREVLLFADLQSLKKLGTNLEVVAASADVTVKLLTLEPFHMQGISETIMAPPTSFADPEPPPWIQIIVDRESWLTASFANAGAGISPCGWWSEDPSLAMIMAASLEAAMDNTIQEPQPFIVDVVEAETAIPDSIPQEASVPEEPEPEIKAPETPESPAPAVIAKEEPEKLSKDVTPDDEEDGLQFIMKHENDD